MAYSVQWNAKTGGNWQKRQACRPPMPRQYLLNRAVWESDEVRDQLQAYVREMMAGPDGMLVMDAHRLSQKGEEIGRGAATRQWDGRTH
ncbi:MAG TPA: hypothetical protein DCL75_06995 [Ktedonobacter sp.]|nr:hypothetical protein [Ktedonobacter sp.]